MLVATTLGGVVGPNLAAPTGDLPRALGIPYLAGPFLLAGTAYARRHTVAAAAGLVLPAAGIMAAGTLAAARRR